jgi:hypothetical protein
VISENDQELRKLNIKVSLPVIGDHTDDPVVFTDCGQRPSQR